MGEVQVMLFIRIVGIGIKVMVRPRLKIVHLCSMLNGGKAKGIPNLAIHDYMIIGTTSITSKDGVHEFTAFTFNLSLQ